MRSSILFINMKIKWSDSEIELLREVYPITNDINVLNYFSGRTLMSIKVKAKKLKIFRIDSIKFENRSNTNKGAKNGMFGKVSIKRGLSYDEFYGIEKSKKIKNKLSKSNSNRKGLCGSSNGMYGKIPHNKGKSPNDETIEKIRTGIRNYWENLSPNELFERKTKLRNEWINKRDKYCEIDTTPEKKVEELLLKYNIEYQKKINIGYYNCDFIVNRTVIEVQGDYWHGNPKIFSEYDNIQKKNIDRDKRKNKYLTSMGYTVLYLWEYDLKHYIDECENKLRNISYE